MFIERNRLFDDEEFSNIPDSDEEYEDEEEPSNTE